ncbi:MAG: 60S ribosomal export protein NMD3 [Halodesulfurarchaeum sp.]
MTAESGTFCPRCGDPIEDSDRGVREPRLCTDCYLESFELVDAPERLSIQVCATCGAVHRGNRWVDVGAEDYTDVAIDALTEAVGAHREAEDFSWAVEPEQVDQNTIRMHASFTGAVRDRVVTEEREIPVTIARGTCTRCGRIAGDYYASIVQLRADDRSPASEERDRAVELAHEVTADMEATGDRNAFVTDVTETGDGVDIKLSTTKIGQKVAHRLVDEFGGTVEDSETLVTEDEDGNEVYRVTYAVRLPRFRPGDIIELQDGDEAGYGAGPVLVRSVHGNLKGVHLDTGERYEASYEEGDTPDARRLGTVEDAVETTVVTVEDENAVQILDPETAEATTVPRPAGFDPEASTVRAFKSRAGLFVVPEDR